MLNSKPVGIFLLFLFCASQGQDHPEIEIPQGKIKGHYKLSYNNRTFAAYEGIPYAKPPIGNLRFEEPIEPAPWSETLQANVIHVCLQMGLMVDSTLGSEDCLYLNVYVPKDITTGPLDVIVFIHGGAFMKGDTYTGGPEYLMDKNVVYVTFAYRLGIFGFLSTEDEVVPGNNGMKDQVMALRWVQKHIEKFGGNPNSVTIAGVSAGAGSVHLHYLSPLSRGLFHRGLLQGGVSIAPWAIQRTPLKKAKEVGALVGCDKPTTEGLVECLKQASANELVVSSQASPFSGFPITPFAPVVENNATKAFLADDPYTLLKFGDVADVPLIIGTTTEEGILGIITLRFQYDNLNKDWNKVLPYVLSYESTADESDKILIAEKIRKFYLDDNDVTEDNVHELINLFTDRLFHVSIDKAARLQTKVTKSPVYVYVYEYKQDANYDGFFGLEKYYGVSHSSDCYLLYDVGYNGVRLREGRLSTSDEKIKDFMVELVTTFAKEGKPTLNDIEWEPITDSGNIDYLLIKNDGIKMMSEKELAPLEFWKGLPLKEFDKLVEKKKRI